MKFLYAIALATTMTSYTLPSLFIQPHRTTFDNYVPTYTSLITLHNKLLEKNLISGKRAVDSLENRKVIRPECVFSATSIASIVNTAIAAHCLMHSTHNPLSVACSLLPTFIFSYVIWKLYFDGQTPDAQIKKLLMPIEKTIQSSTNRKNIELIASTLQSERDNQSASGKRFVTDLIIQCNSRLASLNYK